MLLGTMIDNLVVGGPAYNSRQLHRGDVVLKVDGQPVTQTNIHDAMVGSDVPGSPVVVSVARGGPKVPSPRPRSRAGLPPRTALRPETAARAAPGRGESERTARLVRVQRPSAGRMEGDGWWAGTGGGCADDADGDGGDLRPAQDVRALHGAQGGPRSAEARMI